MLVCPIRCSTSLSLSRRSAPAFRCGGARKNIDAVAVRYPCSPHSNSNCTNSLKKIPIRISRGIMMARPYTRILDFWFSPKSSPTYLQEKPFWYGSPSDDAYVRHHLSADYESAQSGSLDDWQHLGDGEGALALILLLDQVPRNIFRGSPRAYATDNKAVAVARYAVLDRGWDRGMPTIQRRYMYSPFNHSEHIKDQEVSVRLFTELGDGYHLHWARNFYEQIKRDGRFKHRDTVLGRK